jgi:uroporphyrinogen III methyltransferase / synthase
MTNSLFPPSTLKNRTILVACSEKLIVDLRNGLESMGGTVLHFPVLQTKEIEDKQPLDKSILYLKDYDWIIFTSTYGVQFFVKRLRELGAFRSFSDFPKVCAIGPATAAAVAESGFSAALIAKKYAAEGVLAALENYHGGLCNLSSLRILIPRAREAREFLPEALSDAGSQVDVAPCYQMMRPAINPEILDKLHKKGPDLIVFTSASTIRNMAEILGPEVFQELFLKTKVAVIGPITAKTAESQGKCADIIPDESTVSALLVAINEHFVNMQIKAQGTF